MLLELGQNSLRPLRVAAAGVAEDAMTVRRSADLRYVGQGYEIRVPVPAGRPGSALLGERAAMACTVAVESVIEKHYAEQAEQLGDDEAELRDTIEQFRAEEIEHHDTGIEHQAELAPGYQMLSEAVKAGSRLAIWLSTRV